MHALIQTAVPLVKKLAVGDPSPTSVPQEDTLGSSRHYLILDGGKMTVPQFRQPLKQGKAQGIFRSMEKLDVIQIPMLRFDLLQRDAFFSNLLCQPTQTACSSATIIKENKYRL